MQQSLLTWRQIVEDPCSLVEEVVEQRRRHHWIVGGEVWPLKREQQGAANTRPPRVRGATNETGDPERRPSRDGDIDWIILKVLMVGHA